MVSHPQPKRQRLPSASSNALSSLDNHLESVFVLSDPSIPFDLSLEHILESRVLQSDKEDLIQVALRVGSALVDAASRSARKLAAAHNSLSWPLPPELTVMVLSFLDTASLCCASATCTTFSKCASDPLCYENIDLTRKGHKVEDSLVSTMIQRAGKNLKSLKLGVNSLIDLFDSEGNLREQLLTRSCLAALSSDNGASGVFLQKLCLQWIDKMQTKTLTLALSNCKSLIDLEIVGMYFNMKKTLRAVGDHCPLIDRLCFDYSHFSGPPILYLSDFDDLIKKCKMISSLAIRRSGLTDYEIHEIIKGLPKLKYADFSSSINLKGFFIKDLGNGEGGDSLETLILRDSYLKRAAIGQFFNDILAGEWKSLRFLDVSSKYKTICNVEVLHAIKETRPEICLIGDPKSRNDTSSSSSDEDTQNGDEQDITSSSEDEVAQNGDEPNSDSSSDDEVTQNEDEPNSDPSSDDSSSEDQVTQNGDVETLDSSSDDQVTQNGGVQNSDSSSDDEVGDH